MEGFNQTESLRPVNYWHWQGDLIVCDLCPRECKLHENQRGFCFVRGRKNNQMVLSTYGRASGFALDPIEKKPLNHFYPGTSVLSFGTAGCNLACKFCQNWEISKARHMDRLQAEAEPQAIAQAAKRAGALSVAYTYNDPVIFHEFALDTAKAVKEAGLKNVAVTASYVNAKPRAEFYQWMDAANIDLKSFNEDFYRKLTGGHLQPVLETLDYVVNRTNTWVEITTLLIPGQNDSESEIRSLCEWIGIHLGPEVPVHFTAFHPDFRMQDLPPTPPATLKKARYLAQEVGLKYVYTGNILDEAGQSTYCPNCGQVVIGRRGYQITAWHLDNQGACQFCHSPIAGRF